MKRLNEAQFLKQNFEMNDYSKKSIEAERGICKDVNEFHPAQMVYNCNENEGKLTSYENCRILLMHETLEFYIDWNSYSKHFYISCRSIDLIPNIHYSDKSRIMSSVKKPMNIGVLTSNKIAAWLKYYEEVYNVLSEKSKEAQKAKDDFLKSLVGLNVKWWNKGTRGEISENGIRFHFEILESGYISKTVSIDHVENSLEVFKALAENKYKAVK